MSDKFVTYKTSKYQFIFPATMKHETYSCESYAGIIFDTEKGRFDVVDNPHLGHRLIINPKVGGWSDIPFKPATFGFLPDEVKVSENE
jgi:hypothetical protein